MPNDDELAENEVQERQTARQIVGSMIPAINADRELQPSAFIQKYWDLYIEQYPSNQNINGKVFEELIAISLMNKGLFPFYMQAKVSFIPHVNYDFIIYTEEIGPVSLSVKTSLRERWKQADLEALVLKNIHRKSKSYVVSLSATEVATRNRGLDSVMGIEAFVLASSLDYDRLLEKISTLSIIDSPIVKVVTSNIVITAESYSTRYND